MSIADLLRGRMPDIEKSIADHENQVAEKITSDIAHKLKVEENIAAHPTASPKLVAGLTPTGVIRPLPKPPSTTTVSSPSNITSDQLANHPINKLRKGQ